MTIGKTTHIILDAETRRWLRQEIDRRMRARVQRTSRTEREFERTFLGDPPFRVLTDEQKARDAQRKREREAKLRLIQQGLLLV